MKRPLPPAIETLLPRWLIVSVGVLGCRKSANVENAVWRKYGGASVLIISSTNVESDV